MPAIFTALALLILAAGSLLMLGEVLRNRPDDYADHSMEVLFHGTRVFWPLVLGLSGAFAVVAFLVAGEPGGIVVLVAGLVAAYYIVRESLDALTHLNADHLPLRGLPALLGVVPFLVVNVVAVYVAWSLLVPLL